MVRKAKVTVNENESDSKPKEIFCTKCKHVGKLKVVNMTYVPNQEYNCCKHDKILDTFEGGRVLNEIGEAPDWCKKRITEKDQIKKIKHGEL